MRYSKIVLLSTLSAIALLATSNTSPAFAPEVTDMGLLHAHNSTWQVGKIDAKNSSYCAMGQQFDKEISLAFARSQNGSNSLAITFPGNILDTGMTYPITMQVDDEEARRFNARPASAHSFIIQTGQDDDFYSSLGTNGTLHMSMPTMDISFDLTRFSSAYISLVSCSEKLPQHEGPRTAAMPVAPVDSAALPATTLAPSKTAAIAGAPVILTAPKPVDDMQMQVDAVRASLNKKGLDAPVVATAPAAKTVVAAAPVSLASQIPDDMVSARTATAKQPITWAKAAATPVYTPTPIHVTTPAEENEKLFAENIALKSKLAQLQTKVDETDNNVKLIRSEKNDLQSKMDMKDRQYQMLESAANAKDHDLDAVRSVSNTDSKALIDAQTELAALRHDHDQALNELQSKLSEKTAEYDNLQKQFAEGSEVRQHTQQRSVEAEAELETLRQRLAQAQEQIASNEQQKSDLTTQVEFQGQQNKTLLQRVQDQLSKATQQLSMVESQLTSVAMQRDDLSSQLDTEVNKNKALEADLQVKQRELAYHSTPAYAAPVSSASIAPVISDAVPAPAAHDDMNLLGRMFASHSSSSKAASPDFDTVVVQ
jgi:hypothetical protein